MARVKGPNGLVFDFPADVAKGLVESPAGDFEYVEDEKPKKPTAKRSTEK